MTPKETVDYLRTTMEKWKQIKESLEINDTFNEVCDTKIAEAKTQMKQIVNTESPEDFLV